MKFKFPKLKFDHRNSETTFRAVHVLVELFNEAMHTLFFTMLVTCGSVQVLAAVAVINQARTSTLPLLINLFFGTLVVDAAIIIGTVFGFAGNLYKRSEVLLNQLRKQIKSRQPFNSTRKEYKYKKSFLNSCQVAKVKFGLSNFIEKTTPPIFQLFCLNRIIDLLLVN